MNKVEYYKTLRDMPKSELSKLKRKKGEDFGIWEKRAGKRINMCCDKGLYSSDIWWGFHNLLEDIKHDYQAQDFWVQGGGCNGTGKRR